MKEMKGFEKRGFLVAAVFAVLFLFIAMPAYAKTIYVDINNSGVEDGTADYPFNTVQEGINAALPDDTVKVASGDYYENLTIDGVNIKLVGEDPQTTTVHGTSTVIAISGSFNAGYELVEIAGFSITGGVGQGIYVNSNSVTATIHNNVIFGNRRGIYARVNCMAYVFNNVIGGNTEMGIWVGDYGYGPQVTISNNIVVNNGTYGIQRSYGTALAAYNNVWNNSAGNYAGTVNRTGNISEDPLFVDVGSGDYRLASSSPSIDAGQPLAADNDPDGTRNDQGAYGGSGAVNFWPYPAGGPVVTDLSVTPPSVPVGGTLTLKATGKIR